jgi:L-rhamnose mutarotase
MSILKTIFSLLFAMLLAGCATQRPLQRYAWVTDMKRLAADLETQRWWKETNPCQSPLPDAAAKGKIWSDTKEVYFLR